MTDFEQRFGESDPELQELQRLTFFYFLKETNPENGLVPDSTRPGAPCSIAPTGFALAAYPVGVERGFITRDDAISRTLTSLRFFWHSPQGPEPDATGYKGFYYHFLDMKTGDVFRTFEQWMDFKRLLRSGSGSDSFDDSLPGFAAQDFPAVGFAIILKSIPRTRQAEEPQLR